MSLKINPCFLDHRNTFPGLDILSELSSLIDDVVDPWYCLRLRIWIFCHVTVFEKIFDFFENIFDWSDWVIVHFSHLIFEIVQLDQWKNSACCEEVREILMYVSRELTRSSVFHCCNILLVYGCDYMLKLGMFDSSYFVENSGVIVMDLFKLVLCNTRGIVWY